MPFLPRAHTGAPDTTTSSSSTRTACSASSTATGLCCASCQRSHSAALCWQPPPPPLLLLLLLPFLLSADTAGTRTIPCPALQWHQLQQPCASAATLLAPSPATQAAVPFRAVTSRSCAARTRSSQSSASSRVAHAAQHQAERWLTCACIGSRCCGRICPATRTSRRQYPARIITGH